MVIDEMSLAPELMPGWLTALAGLGVLPVKVTCPPEVASAARRPPATPRGLARGHYVSVHEHGVPYDLTVDTTTGTPAEPARSVLRGVIPVARDSSAGGGN